MKCLKIEDNKGWFVAEDGQFKPIDTIGKTDILFLLDKAIDGAFEMDPFDDKDIGHAAHRVIYRDVHDRFTDFLQNRTRFRDESELLFKSAFEKYQNYIEES